MLKFPALSEQFANCGISRHTLKRSILSTWLANDTGNVIGHQQLGTDWPVGLPGCWQMTLVM